MKTRFLILFLSVIVVLAACRKKEKYPAEPHISFKQFVKIATDTGVDDKGILTLDFTDGDGDVGLDDADTLPPFDRGSENYYNFHINYYEKHQGTVTRVDSAYCISGGIGAPILHSSRIPRLSTNTQENTLKGTIEIKLAFNNPCSAYDTILFETYIVDRALHQSNVIFTPVIIVKKK